MSLSCSFDQPVFVRCMMSDGFVGQSKRALTGGTNPGDLPLVDGMSDAKTRHVRIIVFRNTMLIFKWILCMYSKYSQFCNFRSTSK